MHETTDYKGMIVTPGQGQGQQRQRFLERKSLNLRFSENIPANAVRKGAFYSANH